jgi:hypothetical protein
MRVYCNMPTGVVLHDGLGVHAGHPTVTLAPGVNENVDDDFMNAWFKTNFESSPLVADHLVYKLADPQPEPNGRGKRKASTSAEADAADLAEDDAASDAEADAAEKPEEPNG